VPVLLRKAITRPSMQQGRGACAELSRVECPRSRPLPRQGRSVSPRSVSTPYCNGLSCSVSQSSHGHKPIRCGRTQTVQRRHTSAPFPPTPHFHLPAIVAKQADFLLRRAESMTCPHTASSPRSDLVMTVSTADSACLRTSFLPPSGLFTDAHSHDWLLPTDYHS